MTSIPSASKIWRRFFFTCFFVFFCFNHSHADNSLDINKIMLSAEQGDPLSQCQLAGYFLVGRGVPQDCEKAVKWYKKAADQGFANEFASAAANLGSLYYNGRCVPKNYEEAIKWYKKAANQGWLKSQTLLARIYHNGEGVPQDYTDALKWYKKAANQGDANSMFSVGCFYKNGQGVSQNYEEAFKWYEKAANKGEAYSMYLLGCFYKDGQGVPQSNAEARKWLLRAADRGHFKAKKLLSEIPIEPQGPFYSLPGGEYLDAIYCNDKETIARFDRKSIKGNYGYPSLLVFVAHKYMHAYRFNWGGCCSPPNNKDKIEKTFSTNVEEKKYQTLDGMDAGSTPGYTVSGYYIVPKDFSFLLNNLGHSMGIGKMTLAASFFKFDLVTELFNGIDKLQQGYKCNSSEIKQFEKNLISLTTHYFK